MNQIFPPEIKKYTTTDEFRRVFQEFFMSISLSENDPYYAQRSMQIEKLIYLNIPCKLYKYRSVTNYNIVDFIEDEFSLNKAITFNDPFDSLLYFDISGLNKFIEECSSTERLLHMWKVVVKRLQDKQNNGICLNERELNILSLTEEAIKKQTVKDLQDFKPDIEGHLTKTMSSLQKHSYIGSLTEDNNCPLMWGHYADSHKGYCLEYDLSGHQYHTNNNDPTIPYYMNLYPVLYSDKRYCASEYAIFIATALFNGISTLADVFFWNKAFTNKSDKWSYEKEWRIIANPNTGSPKEERIYYPLKPKAIYYGIHFDHRTKKTFHDISHSKGIEEYDMKLELDNKEYILTPVPISLL